MMTRVIAAALFASLGLAGCFSQPASNSRNDPPAAADRAASLDALAPHAAAVGLAEVTALREEDSRPSDGDLAVIAELRYLKSSGETPKEIYIVKEHGGLRPAEFELPPLPGPLRPDSLVQGRRYWFAFSSQYEFASGKHPQQVIGFWDAGAKEAHVFEAAVREDRFAWNPQFDPATALTHSDRSSPESKAWTIRVHKGDKSLWEMTIQGVKSHRYRAWGFVPTRQWEAVEAESDDEPYLLAESVQTLAAKNEYDLPAAEYYVKHAYAANSGRKAATWISTYQQGYAERVFRVYDEQGKVRLEERSDFLPQGGVAAGGETKAWLRKIVRAFDAQTGKVQSEEVFRHGKDDDGNSAWIKVTAASSRE